MNADFINSSSLTPNGYFYTFEYYATHSDAFFDFTPFIFCVGPAEFGRKHKPVDNFISGLNLHHISISDRETLIKKMQEQYDFMSNDKQHLISEWSLNHLCPGVDFGLRIYDMRNCYNIKRVANAAVPKYIYDQGNIYLGTPDDKYLKYLINAGIYKSSEATA